MTFILDSLVMILLVFMGLRDDRRAPGTPPTSLFRTRDPGVDSAPKPNNTPWEHFGGDYAE